MNTDHTPTDEMVRSYALRLRALAEHEPLDNLAMQSIVVAALRTLEEVLARERQVAAAAISMGQQRKLEEMTATLHETILALRELVNEQGRRMLELPTPSGHAEIGDGSWWFSLTEAIQALEKAVSRVASLASGQPKGGPVRLLGSIITRLLRNHHNALLHEAEQWVE